MTIKEIKEQFKDYRRSSGEKNCFVVYTFDGIGKCVIIVNRSMTSWSIGEYVTQVIRVSDGKKMLAEGRCRPCDNLYEDAIDVAGEMLVDNWEHERREQK